VVKIFGFLELEPRLNNKADLTGQAKMRFFKGFDANRLRGGLKLRPLEPDPDHAGVGKLTLFYGRFSSLLSGISV
jgi:hypothetical protein